jgi:2-polyprenyl-3-methyl-5-hydroxy-6-metoxy-1,4-benzoquinol methylase
MMESISIDLKSIRDQSIDLVIASAVLEHIPAPRPILEKLMATLRIGGCLYARTPYVSPFLRFMDFLGINFDFTFPAHLHDLGANFWREMIQRISPDQNYVIVRSNPSVVETSLRHHFFRTIAAHILKIPGYYFKEAYGFVGGWEVFVRRSS